MSRAGHRHDQTLEDYGAIDGTGRTCEYHDQCDAASVYALVWPASDGVPIHCCPYHVGLYRTDHPQQYQRFQDHHHTANPDRYARDDRYYDLDGAPTRHDAHGTTYRLIGIDHSGLAHLFADFDGSGERVTVLQLDANLAFVDVNAYPVGTVTLGDYIAEIDDRRGWVALDEDVLAAGSGGDTDGE